MEILTKQIMRRMSGKHVSHNIQSQRRNHWMRLTGLHLVFIIFVGIFREVVGFGTLHFIQLSKLNSYIHNLQHQNKATIKLTTSKKNRYIGSSFVVLEVSSAASITPSSESSRRESQPQNIRNKNVTHRAEQRAGNHHRNQKQNYSMKKFRIRSMFQNAKELERTGQWCKATSIFRNILDMDSKDSHSYLALAKLEAKRKRVTSDSEVASQVFLNGTQACPTSVHLWQAWAVYEESRGNISYAKKLFEEALRIDPYNAYACHAYGLMMKRCTLAETSSSYSAEAREIWERSLEKTSTAALVCSLGEMLITNEEYEKARELYTQHVGQLKNQIEKTEVYLAMAWLEERYFCSFERAEDMIKNALIHSPTSSVAQIALARLKGRQQLLQQPKSLDIETPKQDDNLSFSLKDRSAMARSLANTCMRLENESAEKQLSDGRVYNAWANLEAKAHKFASARNILARGLARYPTDHSLLQAAGKIEERVGNVTGALNFYRASLLAQPSAPALVSYALLELRRPRDSNDDKTDFDYVEKLFEEALMLDPRHGPAYNAFARVVFERQNDEQKARKIYKRGVRANCTDVASIYHGYAKFELVLGNVNRAREILMEGRHLTRRLNVGMDSPHRERALFLTHTLGMIELNSNRPSDASNIFLDGIQCYGNSSQLLLGAALCEVKLGDDRQARKLFEQAVISDEKHAQAWQAWGVMEMRAGNFNTAKALFECGIKSTPRHGALWQAFGTMQSRLGNLESARALFERGIRMSPKHAPLYQSWASMELREENFVVAKALIAKALTLDKSNGAGWLIAAEIEDLAGNTGLHSLILRRGIECSPCDAKLYRALGDSLVKQGKINEARELMEKGLEVDPLHAPLYHSLAELEARVFNINGLSQLNKRAKAIFNTNPLEPTPASSDVWGSKIKADRSRDIPRGVAALAQRIVEDDSVVHDAKFADPDNFLDEIMHSSNLLEMDL